MSKIILGPKPVSLKNQGKKLLDKTQIALSFFGLILPPADLINAGVSSARAKYAKATGDEVSYKKYKNAALWNIAAVVPGIGEMKMASNVTKQIDDVAEFVANPTTKKTIQTIGNTGYWTGTAKDIVKLEGEKRKEKND